MIPLVWRCWKGKIIAFRLMHDVEVEWKRIQQPEWERNKASGWCGGFICLIFIADLSNLLSRNELFLVFGVH
jgi:hypothetical protein